MEETDRISFSGFIATMKRRIPLFDRIVAAISNRPSFISSLERLNWRGNDERPVTTDISEDDGSRRGLRIRAGCSIRFLFPRFFFSYLEIGSIKWNK